MAEIGFYHLLSMSLERALPKLLERARANGHRVVVRAASPERVEHLNAALWTYEEAAFLPHGSVRDGNPAMQPIWLTHHAENPNGASMIVLVDGLEVEDFQAFTAKCDRGANIVELGFGGFPGDPSPVQFGVEGFTCGPGAL